MKKYFELKNIIIILLTILIVLILLNPKGCIPSRTKTIQLTTIDSIPYPVYDTLIEEVEVEVEVPVEVEVLVEKTVEIEKIQPVDTAAIVKLFSENKQIKKDVLQLQDNIGTITIFDTISNNRILGRSFSSKIKQKIIRDTLKIELPPKNLWYFGVESSITQPDLINNLGVGLMYKGKNEKIYKITGGLTNRTVDGVNGKFTPYVGGGVYWKINLKKK